MGWLFQCEKLGHQTPAEYVSQHITYDSQTTSAIVVAAATVRGTIYAAIRNTDNHTGANYVFCAVILFKNGRDGFGYKSMDETMDPCEVDCPDRIMRLLSPIADIPNPSYAADWRARVAAARVQRQTIAALVPGSRITLKYPVSFRNGVSADRFTLIERRKRTAVFTPIEHPDLLCQLTDRALMTATVET